MKEARQVTDYLTATFLIALFAVLGVTAATTAILAMWPPLAKIAATFF